MNSWWFIEINPINPEKIRIALYRIFVQEGFNKAPEKEKEKAKKFKEYDQDLFVLMLLILQK